MPIPTRKIKLYIASSLDGKIAKPDGNIDWLHEIPNPNNEDYGYQKFYKSVDTTLMGNKTYQQILNFDVDFPYPDKTNYVFTNDPANTKDDHATFISSDHVTFIENLKMKNGNDIWLVGGGQLNSLLLGHGLVDEMMIYIMPIILGDGIPVFSSLTDSSNLILKRLKNYSSGVVELIYKTK